MIFKDGDEIHFTRGTERYRLWVMNCSYCDNMAAKIDSVDNSEKGPYSRTYYHHVMWLAGGRKEGLVLCDNCLNLSGKIKQVKNLEKTERKIHKELKILSDSMQRALDEIKIDKAIITEKIKSVRQN